MNGLPLRIIRQPHSGNWAANTNVALSHARGGYACILHQDDMWLEHRLKIIRSLTEQYPDTDMILHPSWFIDDQGRRLGLWRCPLPALPAMINPDTLIGRLLTQNFISIPVPVFKREAALSVGGLDSRLWFTPDWDLWLKMSCHGKAIYYPSPLSAFRIHSKSQTIVRSINIQDFRKELETVFERHIELWKTTERIKNAVRRTALFSIEMNVLFASILHGKKSHPFKLIRLAITIGPLGLYRYFRDSRITERLFARIKAKF